MSLGQRQGTVESFDDDVGIGYIVDQRGERWLFHCTTIVGGTRVIDPGVEVGFEVAAGGPGHWEAFAVSSLG